MIGGNKFISSSIEYRFPISSTIGLEGILFLDTGNSFAEGENMLDLSGSGAGGRELVYCGFHPSGRWRSFWDFPWIPLLRMTRRYSNFPWAAGVSDA